MKLFDEKKRELTRELSKALGKALGHGWALWMESVEERLELLLDAVEGLTEEPDDTIPDEQDEAWAPEPAREKEPFILAAVKLPGRPAYFALMLNELEALQKQVGGYIEAVPIGTGLVAVCNEEGRLKGLEHNCEINGIDFVGPVVFVEEAGEEFASLDKEAFRLTFPGLFQKEEEGHE